MGGLASLGAYKVELDAGFLRDKFILGSSLLGGTDKLGGSTSFFDVTEYIVSVNISRGRDSQDAQFGASTCSIIIDDLKGQDKFSVANTASPYWNADRGRLGFEPRRKIRISRDGEYLFVGFITAYDTTFDLDGHNMITVNGVDAFFLLTTTTINTFTPPAEKSGARVDRILGLPEIDFPDDPLPVIETGVANLASLEVTAQTPLSYFNKIIETAEQGRLYVDRIGRLTWEARTPKATDAAVDLTFADDASGIPYSTLEVIYE
jgi:hypothetical protein